jgi:hypothetical protein
MCTATLRLRSGTGEEAGGSFWGFFSIRVTMRGQEEGEAAGDAVHQL